MNVFLNSTTCVHHLCGFYLPVKTQEMGGENKIGIFKASSADKSLLFCHVFFILLMGSKKSEIYANELWTFSTEPPFQS